MSKKNLLISFSGGETSAMMTHFLLSEYRDIYAEIAVVFANTGQENDETLEFVDNCDNEFGFNTVWVEAVVAPEHGIGTTHKIVTFETASRDGSPFEAMISKFGIPNQKFPHCTRELKKRPIDSYVSSLGWKKRDFDIAIGIRSDESGRRAKDSGAAGIIYPLLDWRPTTKPEVNRFWAAQKFRLNLRGYQGNCRTCWKKSMRKLLTIIDDDASAFDFFERMENEYGLTGPEFKKTTVPGYRRVFFRGSVSVKDLRSLYEKTGANLERAFDDATIFPDGADHEDQGCVESCEINFSLDTDNKVEDEQ